MVACALQALGPNDAPSSDGRLNYMSSAALAASSGRSSQQQQQPYSSRDQEALSMISSYGANIPDRYPAVQCFLQR